MTSIEWLAIQLYEKMEMKGDGKVFDEILEQAKEMHKKEMKEMYLKGIENYDITFKRKDDTLKDYHIVDTNEMAQLPQQEISDEELEIEEPTGKFILDNLPFEKRFQTANGLYIHYADVCTLLKMYHEAKVKKLNKADVSGQVCLHEWDEGSHNVHRCKKCGKYNT